MHTVSLESQSIHTRTLALPFCERTVRAPVPKPGYPKQRTTLGERLRARRIDLGLTQKEAARRLAVHPASIRSWEDGAKPSPFLALRVLDFLGSDRTVNS